MPKCLLAMVFAAALAAAAALPALAAPTVDPDTCVIDNADVLSSDTEAYIESVSIALSEACGAQIGVYTVDYIGNSTMEGYAYEVFNAWGLGDADKDNGVLLLLVTEEDKYWMSCGIGLETQFTSSVMSTILDRYFIDNFDSGNYDDAACDTVAAIADKLCEIYNVSINTDGGAPAVNTSQAGNPQKGGSIVGFLVLIIVAVIVLAVILTPRRRYYDVPPVRPHRTFFFFGGPRPPRPPRPPRGPGPGPGPGPGGPRPGGPRPGGGPRPSSGPRPGGGSRPSGGPRPGGSRPSGGSFRSGGGSSRGGGVGRR